jgi:hypothetical protein
MLFISINQFRLLVLYMQDTAVRHVDFSRALDGCYCILYEARKQYNLCQASLEIEMDTPHRTL